ncbi:MAG TPA: MFS transporter [Casimicrobiaceae bacterium]|jgi:MFS family permease|nr:MFS transporter [Casimicrobiaceae bacterium]
MKQTALSRLPASVWVLGIVSLLMDTSSELIHSLLPLFLVTTLGVSTFAVGIIEGIAEATAMITKLFSGYLSDYVRRRKPLTVLGYGLAALTKPIFPLASSFGSVVFARFLDRVGKGIRGAPRDALIADITPPELRGASYGLRQALDTVGAVAGPLLAIGAMFWFADNFRLVFWVAVAPAFAAVAVLALGVREPERSVDEKAAKPPIRLADCKHLPARYWWVVALAAVMTLARFSEAFLVLRAQSVHMTTAWIPMVMVVMSAVYAIAAYPTGVLVDRGHQRALLSGGLLALAAADLILASAGSVTQVLAGTAVWGLHMGLTQGLLAALVAETAPTDLRGTAFGFFNLMSGVALLAASVLAGWLWDAYGPAITFLASAVFAVLAWAGLLVHSRG